MPEARAAIRADELLEMPLEKLTAAQFLVALNSPQVDPVAIRLLPDKKKFELWTDEGALPKWKLGELLNQLRREKKKLELEKWIVEFDRKRNVENVFDPGDILRDPVVIDEIAERVAAKLGR